MGGGGEECKEECEEEVVIPLAPDDFGIPTPSRQVKSCE